VFPRQTRAIFFFPLLCACLFLLACSAPAAEIVLTATSPDFTGNIYIGGAVNNPGLYPFSQSDSLAALVAAAGGLKAGASLAGVILSVPDPASAASPQRIDINRADAWLLAALPTIGETRAADIVAYRKANGPFRSVTDLLKVSGIGQATLDKIKDYITVGG
jgi:competence protein ComEA